jgi:hypothetical protein
VIGVLVVVAGGAVLATMRGTQGIQSNGQNAVVAVPSVEPGAMQTVVRPEVTGAGESDSQPIDEPQEWEEQLARARRARARGRFDRAYSIADELPADSVLRATPEFGEIRYRYAQAHITEGERALEEKDPERARSEAKLVLELQGITSKQRQDARRLLKSARDARPKPPPDTDTTSASFRRSRAAGRVARSRWHS